MNIDLAKIPHYTYVGLTAGIVVVTSSLAYSILQATSVVVDRSGVKTYRTAVTNQSELEKQLLQQQVQQAAIDELRNNITDFARQYEAGRQLKEQVDHVADIVPDENIEELKKVINESKHNLATPLASDDFRN